MTNDTGPIGIIGLGAMGSAMAGNLLAHGIAVFGVDTDPARLEAFAGAGGTPSALAEIASHTRCIITSLPSYAAASAVLGDGSQLYMAAGRGTVVIETSTLALVEKGELSRSCAARGVSLLDCPLSGTAHQAASADLVAYMSGDDAEAKRMALRPLSAFTREVVDLGTFGNGTVTKLIANHLVAVHNVAAAEALNLADAAGLDLDMVLDAVSRGAGSSRMLQVRGPLMVAESYVPAGMRVDRFLKDLALISSLARDAAVSTPLLDATHALYRLASASGHDADDTACAFTVMRELRRLGSSADDGS